MKFEHIRQAYFIGIGGIGMSALARYFNKAGKKVAGYDKTPTLLTDELTRENIAVHFDDDISQIPSLFKSLESRSQTLVVYTPAIPGDHKELNWFREHGYKILKRSEVLGTITEDAFTIAVAGTHGKTTTSSIIAHLLNEAGSGCTAFLGGISRNAQSNLIEREDAKRNGKPVVVVEADEFDRSFLQLKPDIAVVTAMDADHLEIYSNRKTMEEAYHQFASLIKPKGVLIYKAGLNIRNAAVKNISYSASGEADACAHSIEVKNGMYEFGIDYANHKFYPLTMGMPGRHNIENAVAAVAVAIQMDIDTAKLYTALNSYQGVKRRFEFHLRRPEITFLDDYAHHPEELKAAITSIRELFAGKKITGIFQPHLFSRTRDFAEEFAQSLSLLDEVILLDIYPAREKPIAGVTSEIIYKQIKTPAKYLCAKKDLLQLLESMNPEVLVTLGAGDIDQLVEPIYKLLVQKFKL